MTSSHSTHARSQTKTGCEEPSLFSTRNKASQQRQFAKGLDEEESPQSEWQWEQSLATKKLVELKKDVVGTTADERRLIPEESLDLNAVA